MYTPVVRRVARSRGFQEADTDNLVQEVFLRVAQSIDVWLERDDRGRFRPWLVRIARNMAIDLLRQRASRKLGVDNAESVLSMQTQQRTNEIEALVNVEYDRAVFDWAARQVETMVEQHTWQAFWLTHVEGLSVSQAAEQLNVRPANIYFGRSRVMSRLRELVKQFED